MVECVEETGVEYDILRLVEHTDLILQSVEVYAPQ